MTSTSSIPYQKPEPPCALPIKLLSAGSAACIADLFTFPLDTAKVRLQIQDTGKGKLLPSTVPHILRTPTPKPIQLSSPKRGLTTAVSLPHSPHYRGLLGTLHVIIKEEGVRGLYGGIGAGLQRQMCFASIRVGFYDDVKAIFQRLFGSEQKDAGLLIRIISGITTGVLCVSVGQPTDVVKIRMQAQGATGHILYRGVFHAYSNIAKTEGIKGLWKGYFPNVTRNSITNAAELVSYDMLKSFIIRRHLLTDNFPCHFLCGFGAGFFATVIASPVDVVKTRTMNAHPGPGSGALSIAVSIFKEGGPMAFYKGYGFFSKRLKNEFETAGVNEPSVLKPLEVHCTCLKSFRFVPSFVRFGSWNVVMFVCYEQLQRLLTQRSLAFRSTFRD